MNAAKKFTLILIFTIAVAALGCLLFFRMTAEAGPQHTAEPCCVAVALAKPQSGADAQPHTGADARTDP